MPCASRPDENESAPSAGRRGPVAGQLARRWLAEPGLPADRRMDRARHLEQQLRDSGKFTYSLKPQQRDYRIDPIEDFITNHPQGHCEYFATTLTLMLRSQGIPARMVVGYKCDEYNPLGSFFQVRQLHAHTWVEAYLEPEQVADDPADPQWRNGGWLRLDPTPGSRRGPRRGRDRATRRWAARWTGSTRSGTTTSWRWTAPGSGRPSTSPSSAGARTPGAAWPIPSGGASCGRRSFGRPIRATGTSASGSVGAGDWWRWPSRCVIVLLFRAARVLLRAARRWLRPRRGRRRGRPIGSKSSSTAGSARFWPGTACDGPAARRSASSPRLAGRATGRAVRRPAARPAARRDHRRLLPRPLRPAAPGQLAPRRGRTGVGPTGRGPRTEAPPMKIGLIGYQGSGKSTLFAWLTGVAADPALGHVGQSAMAEIPEPRIDAAGQNLQPQKNHPRRHRNRRHAGPEPRPRGQRRPAGHDPRGRLPGPGRRRLRRPRSAGRSRLVRRRPPAGRHGDRRQPHRARRRVAEKPIPRLEREQLEHEQDTLQLVLGAMESGKPLREGDMTEEQLKVTRAFRLLEREAADGDRQHGRRRGAPRAVHRESTPELPIVAVPAGLELELARMSPEDRAEFEEEMGVGGSDRDELIRQLLDVSGHMIFLHGRRKGSPHVAPARQAAPPWTRPPASTPTWPAASSAPKS